MRVAMFQGYGEIRAFTGAEVGAMESELSRVRSVIDAKQSQLSGIAWNPLNYALETQRDAMTRMQNSINASVNILTQLQGSRDEVIESGDTERYAKWMALAATIGDQSDTKDWNTQAGYASTTNMVATVGRDTASGLKNPLGIPAWAWAVAIIGGYMWMTSRSRR